MPVVPFGPAARRAGVCVVAIAACVAGCRSSHPGTASTSAHSRVAPERGRPDPRRFLSWDTPRRRVHLTLLAGLGASNNGFNFDDYGRGELLVSVPLGWKVFVRCENRGLPRASCAVVPGPLADRLAFPGATVPDPTRGLQRGAVATFSFTPARTGSFRIASLVPGQAEARMWAVLVVARGGRPAISARPGP